MTDLAPFALEQLQRRLDRAVEEDGEMLQKGPQKCPHCKREAHNHKDMPPGGVDYTGRYVMEMDDRCVETEADVGVIDAMAVRLAEDIAAEIRSDAVLDEPKPQAATKRTPVDVLERMIALQPDLEGPLTDILQSAKFRAPEAQRLDWEAIAERLQDLEADGTVTQAMVPSLRDVMQHWMR